MNERLTIAAMLLATTAQRRPVSPNDVTSAVKCADDLIQVEAGFDEASAAWNLAVGDGLKPPSSTFATCPTIGVDVAAGESQTVAVQVLPTEYVGAFAFLVGDRCHCTDGRVRIITTITDGVKYRIGRGAPDTWIGGQYKLFDRAGVSRGGEYVAILTSTPPAPEPVPEPPTVHVDDMVFEVGDTWKCDDRNTRTVTYVDGIDATYRVGFHGGMSGGRHSFKQFASEFSGCKVERNGVVVAVLSTDPAAKKPEAFAFQVGDVVIIPDVCGRIITAVKPLAWMSETAFESEIKDGNQEFARQLRNGAVWRGGELVREAVA
jgi:hypothetical protein